MALPLAGGVPLLLLLFLLSGACPHNRFGCPKTIISDQGREFVNSVNAELQTLLGTEHRMTSAYRPQSNGLVEKFHHTIQSCLLKVVNDHQNNWDVYLDPILFSIRTSKHKSTGFTPFEMMFIR